MRFVNSLTPASTDCPGGKQVLAYSASSAASGMNVDGSVYWNASIDGARGRCARRREPAPRQAFPSRKRKQRSVADRRCRFRLGPDRPAHTARLRSPDADEAPGSRRSRSDCRSSRGLPGGISARSQRSGDAGGRLARPFAGLEVQQAMAQRHRILVVVARTMDDAEVHAPSSGSAGLPAASPANDSGVDA